MDNSLKDRVLEAADIVAVVGDRVALARKGREYLGLCPFHSDHKPSMTVSPTKQLFKCFSCGAGGNAITFVQKFDRVEYHEALRILARQYNVPVEGTAQEKQSRELREQLLAVMRWACQHFRNNLRTPSGRTAYEYARKRGLADETIERHQLGAALPDPRDTLTAARRTGLSERLLADAGLVVTNDKNETYDRFRNRLIFPIRDTLGHVIAFGGRALDDHPAKYLNSPETSLFSKSRVLFGLDLARPAIRSSGDVIVVEGYLDAVLLDQAGIQNVVATLGTALTDAHLKLIATQSKRLFLCFDGDDAGTRAADRAVEIALRSRLETRVVLLEGGEDPADCVLAHGPDGFLRQLQAAVDALEFKWLQVVRATGGASASARRTALEAFIAFVAGAGSVDPLQLNLLVGRLSDLTRVPADEVFGLIGRARRSQARIASRRTDAAAASEPVSDYELELRGLPAGLAVAFETVIGCLVAGPGCWRWVTDVVSRAAELSPTWNALYAVLLGVHEESGEYSLGEIVAQCQDAALCELVDRSRARVAGTPADEAFFCAARDRLGLELDLLRMNDLRQGLFRPEDGGPSGEDALASLCKLARGQHSVLPAERRWQSRPGPEREDLGTRSVGQGGERTWR